MHAPGPPGIWRLYPSSCSGSLHASEPTVSLLSQLPGDASCAPGDRPSVRADATIAAEVARLGHGLSPPCPRGCNDPGTIDELIGIKAPRCLDAKDYSRCSIIAFS